MSAVFPNRFPSGPSFPLLCLSPLCVAISRLNAKPRQESSLKAQNGVAEQIAVMVRTTATPPTGVSHAGFFDGAMGGSYERLLMRPMHDTCWLTFVLDYPPKRIKSS